ncbi:uncharacterized protein TrAtP1_013310 [Trichoderma atroviride]|uniref:uncharacterized protein n=1 Tax=Hypocrea atroviridis TaxID=63577 RepID=UPI00332E4AF1|nr:hypothetical protein TrAtP1_013310 [Trichoderma atroviride]
MGNFPHVSHAASPNFDAITVDQYAGGVRAAAGQSNNATTTQLRQRNRPHLKATGRRPINRRFPGLSQELQVLTSSSI